MSDIYNIRVSMVYPTGPYVLDVYCCAGGAGRGYQLGTGLPVVGIDKVARPNYCGEAFYQEDALQVLEELAEGMATWPRPVLIHTSPPCQADNTLTRGTNASRGWGRDHVQYVPRTRELLDRIGLPYVIEQPAGGSMIRKDLTLCMDQFPVDPPRVWRHRDFEISGFVVPQPAHPKHSGRVRGWRHGVRYDGDYVAAYGSGGGKATVAEMQHALGIDWTDVREELTEAIPPAYTRHIGQAFMAQSLTLQGRLA